MNSFKVVKLVVLLVICVMTLLLWSFRGVDSTVKKYKYSEFQIYQLHSKYSIMGNGLGEMNKMKTEFIISSDDLIVKKNRFENTYEIVVADKNQENCEEYKGTTYTLKNKDQQLYFLTIDDEGKDAKWYDTERANYLRYVK